METLLDHFRPVLEKNGVDVEKAELEWPQLRRDIYKCRYMWESANLKPWETIMQQFKEDYPNILDVFDLLLCISPASAEVERGFTQLKLIKNDRRNSLKGTSLNKLLAVRMLTPSITDYDPMGTHCFTIH